MASGRRYEGVLSNSIVGESSASLRADQPLLYGFGRVAGIKGVWVFSKAMSWME